MKDIYKKLFQSKTADEVKAAIDAGANVNATDEYGGTPLHRTSLLGKTEICKILVDKGADVNAQDRYNWTPLHSAARNGRTETCQFLIEKGADVNVKDEDGKTPLDRAGYQEIKDLLIKEKDDVKTSSFHKSKIIKIPIFGGSIEIVLSDNIHSISKEYAIDLEGGYTAITSYMGFKSYRVIFSLKDITPGLIAHEANHLLNSLFIDIEHKNTNEEDEVQSYILAWLVNRIHEFVNEFKN